MSINPAGWYPDAEDPSMVRFWSGHAWTEQREPLTASTVLAQPVPYSYQQAPAQMPFFRGVRMIVLALLIVSAISGVLWGIIWQLNKPPSEFDCLGQSAEVVSGDRTAVDSDCARYGIR